MLMLRSLSDTRTHTHTHTHTDTHTHTLTPQQWVTTSMALVLRWIFATDKAPTFRHHHIATWVWLKIRELVTLHQGGHFGTGFLSHSHMSQGPLQLRTPIPDSIRFPSASPFRPFGHQAHGHHLLQPIPGLAPRASPAWGIANRIGPNVSGFHRLQECPPTWIKLKALP